MNALSLLIALCFVGLCACAKFTEQDYQSTFTEWMQKHQKAYTSEVFEIRYNIFKSHVDFVDAWNADASHTHKVELNHFADMSNEEYQRIYLGTRITVPAFTEPVVQSQLDQPMTDAVNWANKGAVTGVKNQGQCGSCWSFSTTGSVEALNQIFTGKLIPLSEQNLMDCSTAYGNNGCNGGLMDSAFKYIKANNGIETEAAYPYKAVQGTCAFNSAYTGAAIGGYTDVTAGDESALVNAVNLRPVSVAIDASHTSYQLYASGVYYEPSCSTTALDHGVLVIGYGTDTSDYYIVKNSWGASWGLSGYIWMARNKSNNCGIATMASYPMPL